MAIFDSIAAKFFFKIKNDEKFKILKFKYQNIQCKIRQKLKFKRLSSQSE